MNEYKFRRKVAKLNSRSLCPLALSGALGTLHKAPVDVDFLSEDFRVVHRFFGGERLLVGLIFDECVALEEAGTTIEIQVNVFDVAKLAELLLDVVLVSLLVNGGDEQDPAFDS